MARGLLAMSAIFGAACAPAELELSVPFASDARSALVLIEDGPRTEVHGVDIGAGRRAIVERTEISDDRPLHVVAVSYPLSLAELGVAEGLIRPASEGDMLAKNWISVRELSVGTAGVGAWVEVEVLPAALEELRVQKRRCRPLEITGRWELDGPEQGFTGLARLPSGGRALVVKDVDLGPALYVPDGDRLTLMAKLPGPADTGIQGERAISDARGRVWITGGQTLIGGAIVRYEPRLATYEHLLERTTGARRGDYIVAFSFDPGEPDRAIIGVTRDGQLVHWSQSRAGVLEVLSSSTALSGAYRAPAVFTITSDNVLFTRPGGHAIHRWNRGVLTTETTAVDTELANLDERILSLTVLSNGDAFAGTASGTLLLRGPDGRWDKVGEPVLVGGTVWALVPLGSDELIAVGNYGAIQQYDRERRSYCSEASFTNNKDEIFYAELDGEDLWLAGRRRSDESTNPDYFPFLAHVVIRER